MDAKTKAALRTTTSLMKKTEKIINWYNRKYNFNMEAAKPEEQKEYSSMLKLWDKLKAHRDTLAATV